MNISAEDKLKPVIIPQVGVNDERVTISYMNAEAGQKVRSGDLLFSVTTSKADFDVEAEAGGYFWPIVTLGDEIEIGATAAYVSESSERPSALDKADQTRSGEKDLPRATRKAIDLAEKLGVSLSQMPRRGIIREQDVSDFAAGKRGKEARPEVVPPLQNLIAVDLPQLDPGFLSDIRHPESGFAQLSSDLKVRMYKRFGARLGKDIVFERGAAIYAEHIELGDGCSFGTDSVIQAESLQLGVRCLFGKECDIMCRHIRIGDSLFLVNRVLIGQGGAFNEESALIVGHSCLISSDCLINTANRVTIGNVSCLSPRVSVYTHSHWQNTLEGYSVNFAPVHIGNHVWVTGNCLIAPGVVMEDGSQALGNSLVVGRVPAKTIVAGVPAKPLSTVRGDLSPAEKDQIMRTQIWPRVERALKEAGHNTFDAVYSGHTPLAACPALLQAGFGPCPESYQGTYFDLSSYMASGPTTPLSDEVRNVLRKHGIRFEPHTWRYRADVGRFNA